MCSIVGHVVSNILLYEEVLNWYGKLLNKLPTWLGKPLGLCVLCFSGQLTLWCCAVYCYNTNMAEIIFLPYSVCLSILLVSLYKWF